MMSDFGPEDGAFGGIVPEEELAVGQFARPRFQLDLGGLLEGQMFEVDKDEEDLDLLESYDEEVYDEETYATFEAFIPGTRKEIDADGNEQERSVFYLDTDECADFSGIESQMEDLLPDGTIKKQMLKRGNGCQVPERCRVYYHYSALAEGSTYVYDSSVSRKYPKCDDLRVPESLIEGLYLALTSMELNEVSRFVIHPDLGYGEYGCAPRIPGNTKILFVIETLQFIDEARLNTPLYMPMDERNNLPFDDVYEVSHKLRKDGNGIYQNGNYRIALKNWRRAATILEDYPATDPVMCGRRSKMLQVLYANIAQAYIKMEKPAQACNACKTGLKMGSGQDNSKLVYRFAKAKLMLRDAEGALNIVENGLKVDPEHDGLKKLRKEARVEYNLQLMNDKSFWKRALGTFNNLKSKASKSKAEEVIEVESLETLKDEEDNASNTSVDELFRRVEITIEGESTVELPSPPNSGAASPAPDLADVPEGVNSGVPLRRAIGAMDLLAPTAMNFENLSL